jgi:hypothetical protein
MQDSSFLEFGDFEPRLLIFVTPVPVRRNGGKRNSDASRSAGLLLRGTVVLNNERSAGDYTAPTSVQAEFG